MRVFDVHLHYNGDLDELERGVDLWQEAGIEKGVIFALNELDGSYASLEDIDKAWKKRPEFIIPFGYLNPGRHDCLAEIQKAIDMGFKGMKLIFPDAPYDDDKYFPIYEKAAAAGMVLLFHTGIVKYEGIGPQTEWRASSGYMRPIHLDRIGRSFPDMTIIGAHLGTAAYFSEACHIMRWVPNIYFDMCIGQFHYVRKGTPEGEDGRLIKPQIQELYDTGALDLNRVLFGTDGFFGRPDNPLSWYMRTLEFELDAIGATEEEKKAVQWETAAGIFGV